LNLQPRDRRALAMLAASALLAIGYRFWPESSAPGVVGPVGNPVSNAERRLARLRETAATVPAKEAIFKKISAELNVRERRILAVASLPQSQAQLMQILRRVGSSENSPVEIRATELGSIRDLGGAYGEATVAVQVECRIDQMVNMLAAIPAQPEWVALSDLRVTSTNAKEKTLGARLTLSGVVPAKLVPEENRSRQGKKGGPAF